MLIKQSFFSFFSWFVMVCLIYGLQTAMAGQLKTENGYVIHYNALSTEIIPPEVARNSGIVRSKNRAMLTVAVHKAGENNTMHTKAVEAAIEVEKVNLSQQLEAIEMRRVQEGDAIYYIGVFKILNQEVLDFTLKIDPENKGQVQEVKFRQQFFFD
jgi:hypothetical protein